MEAAALKSLADTDGRVRAETEAFLASIPSAIIGLSEEDRIFRWNAEAERVFGFSAGEVLGRRFEQVKIRWESGKIAKALRACKTTKRPQRLDDIRFSRTDGSGGFWGATISPVLGDNGRFCGILLLGADITERKILESQLAQAQKLKSIGQLAAGIAHEINTPTQYIGDNLRFLQDAFRSLERVLEMYNGLLQTARSGQITQTRVEEVEQTLRAADLNFLMAEIPQAIEQAMEGVGRVAAIVGAMKEFSHPGLEEKVPIDVNRAIESTIIVSRNKWKQVADVITDFDRSMPLVPCIPGEFNQVILNMIVNAAEAVEEAAAKAGGGKGTITIRTRGTKDWAQIEIADTGTGIPEHLRTRIFDPFFTTKEVGKGTGQGLAICHSVIVEKHGGSISLSSEAGKGTAFFIRLPMGDGKTQTDIGT